MRMLRITLLSIFLLSGCKTSYYFSIVGEDDMLGMKVPREGTVQLSVFQHLNGASTSVRDPADIIHSWTSATSNSYFGVIQVNESMSGRLEAKRKTGEDDTLQRED